MESRRGHRSYKKNPKQSNEVRKANPVNVSQSQDVGIILSCACFVITAMLYVSTLYPSVSGGNSGQLIVAAHELGAPYPPGYPLFTVLAKMFQLLFSSISNPAWATGLLSSLFGAATSAGLCYNVYRITDSTSSALFAALSFALSRPGWQWSIIPEVVSLNNLFVTLIIGVTVRFADTVDAKRQTDNTDNSGLHDAAYVGFFSFGLSLTNKHSILLYSVCTALWVLLELRREKALSPGVAVRIIMCLALGLLPYAYLPMSGFLGVARFTWGDHTSFYGVFYYVFRYNRALLPLGPQQVSHFLPNIVDIFVQITSKLTWVVIIFALLGFTLGRRNLPQRFRKLMDVWRVMFAAYFLYVAWSSSLNFRISSRTGATGNEEKLWVQSALLICFFAGIGISAFIKDLEFGKTPLLDLTKMPIALRKGITNFLTVTLIAFLFLQNRPICDQSNNTIVRDFGMNLLQSFPNKSIVLVREELTSSTTIYLQLCEGVRPDIRLVNLDQMPHPWYVKRVAKPFLSPRGVVFPGDFLYGRTGQLADGSLSYTTEMFLDANNGKDVFTCPTGFKRYDETWRTHYRMRPWGTCQKFVRGKDTIEEYVKLNKDMYMWNHPYSVPSSHGLANRVNFRMSWDRTANENMWEARGVIGYYLLGEEVKANEDRSVELFQMGFQIYQSLIDKATSESTITLGEYPLSSPPVPTRWHKNLGLAAAKLKRLLPKKYMFYAEMAHRHYSTYIFLAKEYGETDEDLPNIERFVSKLAEEVSNFMKKVDKAKQSTSVRQ